MATIRNLFKHFQEIAYSNTILGEPIDQIEQHKIQELIVEFVSFDDEYATIVANGVSCRFRLSYELPWRSVEEANSSALFLVTTYNANEIAINYIPCGKVERHDTIDFAYGEEIILAGSTRKKTGDSLFDRYCFSDGEQIVLLIMTYPNNDSHYNIYGLSNRADISLEDGRCVVKNESSKTLSKKSSTIDQLRVAVYKSVSFKEHSQASLALDFIREKEKSGETILKLWQRYGALEYEKALRKQSELDGLRFQFDKAVNQGLTKIKMLPTEEQRRYINASYDEIMSMSFEIKKDAEERSKTKPVTYKFKVIYPDNNAIIYDENNCICKNGYLTISIAGDKSVNSRRDAALKALQERYSFILSNLRIAIEGEADKMATPKRDEHYKAETERTRKLLKKEGITLTDDQREAIEIALNTPDIALIQGPPGTGKTTVVSVICDRLQEIAEEEGDTSKLILVSAFQNDTVEHIAGKIKTKGLPTVKIGKDSTGVPVEEHYAQELYNKIDKRLSELNSDGIRLKSRDYLMYAQLVRNYDSPLCTIIDKINNSIQIDNIEQSLSLEWKEIALPSEEDEIDKKVIEALHDIICTRDYFTENGNRAIRRVLRSCNILNEHERYFLDAFPEPESIKESDLQELCSIRERLLSELADDSTKEKEKRQNIYLWLLKLSSYFERTEAQLFENKETFELITLNDLLTDLRGNPNYIKQSIKNYSQGIAATNQIAGSREMDKYSEEVENVILEEAARSNPLDLLIPVTRATRRVIMVGDQKQLPHLLEEDIVDEAISNTGENITKVDARDIYEVSLFKRIFDSLQKGSKIKRSIQLTHQFRMHPAIAKFISRMYYNDTLKDGYKSNQEQAKQHGLTLPWAKDKVMVFCNIPGITHGYETTGKSKQRVSEAERIIDILDEMKQDPAFEALNIGIITFYSSQVKLIFEKAAERGYAEQLPNGEYTISRQYKTLNTETKPKEKLRIGSVDSFQGKEFDIVILSTVRSNNYQRINDNDKRVFGFLTLENRLNVAFSRAQKMVIVVGDGDMFANDYAKEHVPGLYEFCTNESKNPKYGITI